MRTWAVYEHGFEDAREKRNGGWGLSKLGIWEVTWIFKSGGNIRSLSCVTLFMWTRDSSQKGKLTLQLNQEEPLKITRATIDLSSDMLEKLYNVRL